MNKQASSDRTHAVKENRPQTYNPDIERFIKRNTGIGRFTNQKSYDPPVKSVKK